VTTAIGIREYLAETLLPGASAQALDWSEVSAFIRTHYIGKESEKQRMQMHSRRHDLYNDNGDEHLSALIEKVFRDPKVKALRETWIGPAQYNNVLKRIVNELSTVYAEPAARSLGTDVTDKNNEKYRQVQRRCRQDEQFLALEQLLNLHRALWVGFRVRNAGTKAVPRNDLVVDIVTPEVSFAIAHTTDPTVPIALGVKIDVTYARDSRYAPAWVVWTEKERFHLDKDGFLIESSVVEHGIEPVEGAVGPYVFVTLEPPRCGIWPGKAGEDLVAADLSVKFAAVCLLKEMKSATKQTFVTGDMSSATRDQPMDVETMASLPEGTSIQTADMSIDINTFKEPIDHVIETTANNYGMSAGQIHQEGAQSGDARDAQRVPLREIRLRHQHPLRFFEERFVRVQAAVLKRDLPELAFVADGFRLSFADPQTPRMPIEAMKELEEGRRLGVTSTIEWLMQRLSIDRDTARKLVQLFIADELWRNTEMRPLQVIAGTPGATLPSVSTASSTGTDVTGAADLNGRNGAADPRAKQGAA
jgi:hypothetical protein